MDFNLIENFNKLLKIENKKSLSKKLNVASGTLNRWIQLNYIPKNYQFDVMKLLNMEIDYSKFSSKEKDQFFTPEETAKKCFEIFKNTIKKYNEKIEDFKFIEPSAGNGNFVKILPKDTIALDIEPKHTMILKQDFLEWYPEKQNNVNYVVFGNPPFGLRGHLALHFINHSYDFAEYVCFILPQMFESDGKGSPRKRVKKYNLIYSEKIESNFYEPDNKTIKINTIFQIWSKNHSEITYNIQTYSNKKMKIFSLSDGGTSSSIRNKNMIGRCDVYLPSTCFGKENMKCYYNFEDLPNRKGYGVVFYHDKENMIKKISSIKWYEVAFLSTNSAYNLRSSKIYSLFDT